MMLASHCNYAQTQRLTVVRNSSLDDVTSGYFNQAKLRGMLQTYSTSNLLHDLISGIMEVEAGERLREEVHVLPINERDRFSVPEEVFESDVRGGIEARFGCELDAVLGFSG